MLPSARAAGRLGDGDSGAVSADFLRPGEILSANGAAGALGRRAAAGAYRTFLALALFSGGYRSEPHRTQEDRRGILLRAGLYLAVVLALALPQLVGNAVRQTLEGGALRFQFNWVNSGGRGLRTAISGSG